MLQICEWPQLLYLFSQARKESASIYNKTFICCNINVEGKFGITFVHTLRLHKGSLLAYVLHTKKRRRLFLVIVYNITSPLISASFKLLVCCLTLYGKTVLGSSPQM